MKLTGKQTWVFEHPIFVNSEGTAVGPKEKDGPLGSLFDKTYDEMHCNQKNWEMAERQLMEDAVSSALQKTICKKTISTCFSQEISSIRMLRRIMWRDI